MVKNTHVKENLIFIKALYDPRISRTEKILVKFCPNFLDLNARIYGIQKKELNQKIQFSNFINNFVAIVLPEAQNISTRYTSDVIPD